VRQGRLLARVGRMYGARVLRRGVAGGAEERRTRSALRGIALGLPLSGRPDSPLCSRRLLSK
jgi:hypothetical protein